MSKRNTWADGWSHQCYIFHVWKGLDGRHSLVIELLYKMISKQFFNIHNNIQLLAKTSAVTTSLSYTINVSFFSFPPSSQNDYLATNRQTDDPAEQSQGVPPEIHTAVFLNCPISSSYYQWRNPPTTTKRTQPIRIHLSLISAFSTYGGSGGLCDDALEPLHLSHLDIRRRYTRHCFVLENKTKLEMKRCVGSLVWKYGFNFEEYMYCRSV